jgi:signal transduction histidine kinase
MKTSKTSIAKKLIFWIVSSSILIASMISFFYLKDQYQQKIKSVHMMLENIEMSSMKTLSTSLYAEDEEQTVNNLKGIMSAYSEIVQISIWSPEDSDPMFKLTNQDEEKKYYKMSKKELKSLGIFKKVPIYRLEDGSSEHIGDMHLTVSLEGAKKQVKDQIYAFAIIQLVQVALISLIIWFIFKSLVSRHLSHMAAYAGSMNLNDLSGEGLNLTRQKGSKDDELDNLVFSFNDMRSNLKEAHAALKDYAVNLENKVAERTKEIEEERLKVANLLNNMRQAVFSIDNKKEVVSPVSSFSNKVFGKEIEGTDVFETIYKDIDKKSEAYAQLKSALGTIFGEDDLQYDLMEDYFIQKASYTDPAGKEENKILQFSYNPMFNKNDELEKLMFIVEDITEIEKLAAEKAAKDKEIAAINEIASSKIDDVKNFILGAHLYIENSKAPLQEYKDDHSKSSNLGEIFRNLHTLKGNSRIFSLSTISQTTHVIESDLVNIIDEIKEGKDIEHERIDQLFQGFVEIEESIKFYLEIGKRIFSFGNADEITVKKGIIEEIQKLIGGLVNENENIKKADYCIKKIIFNSFLDECNKFKKMVADIASKLDKKAELNVSGEDIFLENQKLDLISDALTHILRNSIDHGIEKMDKRKERQKEEFGTISISTKDVNNIFEILIVDDGNGIDGDRVMNSAVKKGALAKEKADTMNDDEKVNLIFLPNLSTAETVSEVSGRGVGMDVVKSNIEKLGGEIKVSSKLGQGTTFKISFPSAA